MHWHPDGTYLCVKVDRQKSKKTTTYSFELFRIKERDIPIEVLEIKDSVVAFAWEPKGHRFCLVHGEQPRPDISFYTMLKEGKAAVSLLKTLEKKPVNELFWSPMGHHIVLAGLKNLNGMLNFYNVDEMESMNEDEHFLCTDLVWDPTGRYVCTYVSAFRQPMENGYTIWNFAGRPQLRTAKDKFFQVDESRVEGEQPCHACCSSCGDLDLLRCSRRSRRKRSASSWPSTRRGEGSRAHDDAEPVQVHGRGSQSQRARRDR